MARRRYRQGLTGIAAVCLLVGGSRWASYLGREPVFLTDVLLLCAGLHLALSRTLRRGALARQPVNAGLVALAALLVWTGVRYLSTPAFSVTVLRDLGPYLYVGVALISYSATVRSRAAGRSRTSSLLLLALLFHGAWVGGVLLVPALFATLPEVSPGIRLLSGRPDVDTVLLGVLAAYLLARLLSGTPHVLPAALGLSASLVLVVLSSSRAGFLGAVLCCTAVVASHWRPGVLSAGRRRALVLLLPVLLALLVLVVPQTAVGQRLAGTVGLSVSAQGADSAGTTSARARSWSQLIEYGTESPGRLAFGVGFGPDFMEDSGAKVLLVGEDGIYTTRAPHNYWLNTFARLGLLGVALLSLALALAARAVWTCRRSLVSEPLLLLTSLVVLGLTLPAALGVVLEAPFGAVPYFWSLGVVLAWPSLRDRRPRAPDPADDHADEKVRRHQGQPDQQAAVA